MLLKWLGSVWLGVQAVFPVLGKHPCKWPKSGDGRELSGDGSSWQAEWTECRDWKERRLAGGTATCFTIALGPRSGSGVLSSSPPWLNHPFSTWHLPGAPTASPVSRALGRPEEGVGDLCTSSTFLERVQRSLFFLDVLFHALLPAQLPSAPAVLTQHPSESPRGLVPLQTAGPHPCRHF